MILKEWGTYRTWLFLTVAGQAPVRRELLLVPVAVRLRAQDQLVSLIFVLKTLGAADHINNGPGLGVGEMGPVPLDHLELLLAPLLMARDHLLRAIALDRKSVV